MPVFFHKFLPFTDKPPLETIKLEPERDEVFVGENLSCSAQANPAPRVELKLLKNTSKHFNRTWLKIQSITEGNYTVECRAWNDHGDNTRRAVKSIRSEYYQGADFSTFCVNLCIKKKTKGVQKHAFYDRLRTVHLESRSGRSFCHAEKRFTKAFKLWDNRRGTKYLYIQGTVQEDYRLHLKKETSRFTILNRVVSFI